MVVVGPTTHIPNFFLESTTTTAVLATPNICKDLLLQILTLNDGTELW